jgi:cytochrome P450
MSIDVLNPGERRTTLVAGIALLSVLYGVYILAYRLFLSPLAKIPGPFLTRISTIPEANALKLNRRAAWVTELFQTYPDSVAVRTGPHSVSFNHPDAVKAIYGHAKATDGFGKSSWYDSFSTTGESLFSTRSKQNHAMKRRMVSHGFSMQSLQSFEPLVDATLKVFMSRMDEFAKTGEPFDVYFWFELFTMDVLGELALGSSFGALEAGKQTDYARLVEQSQRFANYSGLLPFGKLNVKLLSLLPLPSIQKLYAARLEYLEFAKNALLRRFEHNRQADGTKPVRQDIMQRFIDAQDPETGHRMDFNELRAETSSLMVAGASTGSVTMNW